jgi:hypothetical protein
MEAPAFAPAQVHAQQHIRPVLGFSAAGTGLDIDERVGGVHFAGKHAAKFERLELRFQPREIFFYRFGGLGVLFLAGQTEQLPGFFEPAVQRDDGIDDGFEFGALPAEPLRPLGIVPQRRVFVLPVYFFQAFPAAVEVKDTP